MIVYVVFQVQDFQAAVEWRELLMLTADKALAQQVAHDVAEYEPDQEVVVEEWELRQ